MFLGIFRSRGRLRATMWNLSDPEHRRPTAQPHRAMKAVIAAFEPI